MSTCFFIGHRDAPLSLQEKLNETVEYLVKKCNVDEFIVGYHGNFDHMATIAVQKAKERRPELYAYRLLAYHPGERDVPIPAFFDDSYYPIELVGVPRRYAIEKANQITLDNSRYLVAYVCRDGGNAAKLLRRARRLEKKGWLTVISLADSF